MRTKKNWVGLVFGRLTVISENGQNLFCSCSCGNNKNIHKSNIGVRTISCGCRMNETKRKHSGLPTETPTHNSWENMLSRTTKHAVQHANCINSYYGIVVCDRWKGADGFRNFVADMGETPKGLSLERIDNSHGYSPENCRWASRKEQQNNLRRNILVTLDDMCEYTLEEAAYILGKTKMQVWHMKNKGQLKWRYRY